MEMREKSKKEKVKNLLLIMSLLAVAIVVLVFAVIPGFTVVDDVDRFDELKVGNKVVLGYPSRSNTWRVEKKDGTRVLLVNEKSIQDTYFFEDILFYKYDKTSKVLPVFDDPPSRVSRKFFSRKTLQPTKLINYLQVLNCDYLSYLFPYSIDEERNMKDLRNMICRNDSGDCVFVRVRFGAYDLDIDHSNVYDYDSQLMRLPREYYPAMWIDTARILSDK